MKTQAGDVLGKDDGKPGVYLFYCPGCRHSHAYFTKECTLGYPVWEFNGDMQKPTFTPSLKNTSPPGNGGEDICHLYVTNGEIDYCLDSTHEMKGKTIKMQPF